MNASVRMARVAGILWILSAVCGGFGLSTIRGSVIVSGDAAATAAKLMASELLFRFAIVGNLLAQVCWMFVGLALYRLFREAQRSLAMVLLASALLTIAVAVANQAFNFGALLVLQPAEYWKAFSADQLHALAMFMLRLANAGQGLLELFWTPFYCSLGLLVIRTGYLPRILGMLLMLMGVGFALNILNKFLAPQFYPALFTQGAMALGALGGLPTMFWLTIKGVRAP